MSKKDKKDKSEGSEELSKDEKLYLNSKSRMAKRIIFSIIEYVVIIIILMAIANYSETGSIGFEFDKISKWLEPGGMLFNAILGFLPILVLENIGVYYGMGTYGRLVFGLIKTVALILWLYLIINGASSSLEIDSVYENMGLEGARVNLEGLAKFGMMVFTACLLIPIGEFLGGRKKHLRALEKQKKIENKTD